MIKNQETAQQILDMMNTGIECAEYLYDYLAKKDYETYEKLLGDLYGMIRYLQSVADALKEEESGLSLPAAIESVRVSLLRISSYVRDNVEKALHKIEFELIPLMEEMRGNFYFWGMVYPDREKMQHYYKEEIFQYFRNYYIEEAEKTGKYKYDLSIVVTAYNKLDYTKGCVESLLKYLPETLKYELIFVNHGSRDGTKEYFESIHPDKQLDIAVNGGGNGAMKRIVEGKYFLAISNDIVISKNAILNMYRCMESDDSIAWVVPSTSNISNLQSIPMNYKNMEEFFDEAEKNNISNHYRWEQRVRLCNPIDLRRNSVYVKMPEYGYFFSKNRHAFPDDRSSLLYRRNGYKLMLAKDAYCHHYGHVTIREEWKREEDEKIYLQGRREFFEIFGVDPWGTGFCYDYELFQELPCDKSGKVKILGINCGLGSNSLKIKELLKENIHNTEVTLYNYTQEKNVLEDLKGISDEAGSFQKFSELENVNENSRFDYILIEQGIEQMDKVEVLKNLMLRLNQEGYMVVHCKERNVMERIKKRFLNVMEIDSHTRNGKWFYWKKEA